MKKEVDLSLEKKLRAGWFLISKTYGEHKFLVFHVLILSLNLVFFCIFLIYYKKKTGTKCVLCFSLFIRTKNCFQNP